jgi:hypothetical protein
MKCNTLNRECHAEPFAAPSLRSGLRLTQGKLREASLSQAQGFCWAQAQANSDPESNRYPKPHSGEFRRCQLSDQR